MGGRSPAHRVAAALPWLFGVLAMLVPLPSRAEIPLRVRGVVASIREDRLKIKERNGHVVILRTDADSSYAYVVSSSVDAIKSGDFIGSAVKGPPDLLAAVEIAIIPANMQAGRIGYYEWDPLPDPAAAGAVTATSMTNGVVLDADPGTTAMLDAVALVGRRTLEVSYDGGSKRFRMAVPPNTPVVRYHLADRNALTLGCIVVVKTNPGGRAGLITIGRGIVPPM